jgi:hypothetical protein
MWCGNYDSIHIIGEAGYVGHRLRYLILLRESLGTGEVRVH